MRAPQGLPRHCSSAPLQLLAGERDPSSPLPLSVERLCGWVDTMASAEGQGRRAAAGMAQLFRRLLNGAKARSADVAVVLAQSSTMLRAMSA